MLTPPSVRRPWQLASEAATLDQLSGGRLIISLGLGAAEDMGFDRVGEATDRRTRAERLDETIDILDGLWGGFPFDYQGRHYTLSQAVLQLRPAQSPRIPTWVVGAWPSHRSMRRVLRCDGIIPARMTAVGASTDVGPRDVQAIQAYVLAERPTSTLFDIVVEGETPAADSVMGTAIVQPFAEAGATWWLEAVAGTPYRSGGAEGVRQRIRSGPPHV